jgi:hypothetical protein
VSRNVLIGIVVAVAAAGGLLVAAAVGVTVFLSRTGTATPTPMVDDPAPGPKMARPEGPLEPRVVFHLERSPEGRREDPLQVDPPLLRPDDVELVGAETVDLPRSGWSCRIYRRPETPAAATVGCLHTPARYGPGGPQASASQSFACETATVSNPLVLSSLDRAGWVDWYVRVECREPTPR